MNNFNVKMWDSDSVLAEIIQELFENDSPFQCLPEQIEPEEAQNKSSLQNAFKRLLHCQEAGQASGVVFLWILDQPYVHQNGRCEPSTVIRIEKSDNSIRQRWTSQNINSLVTDYEDKDMLDDPDDLRSLADNDINFSFFSEIISNYGPLRIWWASVEDLNAASADYSFDKPQKWENLICRKYYEYYDCYPLKDKKCG